MSHPFVPLTCLQSKPNFCFEGILILVFISKFMDSEITGNPGRKEWNNLSFLLDHNNISLYSTVQSLCPEFLNDFFFFNFSILKVCWNYISGENDTLRTWWRLQTSINIYGNCYTQYFLMNIQKNQWETKLAFIWYECAQSCMVNLSCQSRWWNFTAWRIFPVSNTFDRAVRGAH